MVTDSAARAARGTRPESREATELRAIRSQQPQLQSAVDLHLELLEVQRRIQGRVPLPMLEITSDSIPAPPGQRHADAAIRGHPARSQRPASDGSADRRRASPLRRAGGTATIRRSRRSDATCSCSTVTGQWFRSGFEQQVASVGVPASGSFAELDGAR